MRQQIGYGQLVLAAIAITTACQNEPLACLAPNDGPAVLVDVRDSGTNVPAAFGALGVVRDHDFIDSLRPFLDDSSGSALVLAAAAGRPGTYTVSVERRGFQVWTAEDVVVDAESCPVTSVTLYASLHPSDSTVVATTERLAIPADEWSYFEVRNLTPDTVDTRVCYSIPRTNFERQDNGEWVVEAVLADICDARGGTTLLLLPGDAHVFRPILGLSPGRYRFAFIHAAVFRGPLYGDTIYSNEFTVCDPGTPCSHDK